MGWASLETSLESLDPSKRMDRGLARIWDNVRGGKKVRELKREGRKEGREEKRYLVGKN